MKKYFLNKNIIKNLPGYTLVELLVATTVFTIVTIGAFTVLFAAQNGYDRVSGSRITTDNINLVLDTMSREIKFGSEYKCANYTGNFPATSNYTTLNSLFDNSDISGKCNAFAFIPQGWPNKRIVYYYNITNSTVNQLEYTRANATAPFTRDTTFGDVPLTSTGFKVDSFNFNLKGVSANDYLQAKVILNITGIIDYSIKKNGAVIKTTDFSAQTAITQRLLDN
ncbi:hypothetical protein SDC9_08000 [bioreactor metagenome]|uniref:Prepilin-type N-terminal cleavage/methylation domain-containing protein n=1 Tax=bioreactor metagenome TaxID=1076179 RepID=A0A644T692_9ZZZZ|nr:prepilin-type N-terminal cleavage/methylation domain-containing protein [Candidatus Elulimicrobiales bacterium]